MKSPIISVVMSVYNGELFLRDSIKSILNQTFRDFEYIIVNDGSSLIFVSNIFEYSNM